VTTWEDRAKQKVAEAAMPLIGDGMRIGLGTGTTVAHLLPLLPGHAADVCYYASSPQTERAALELGLEVRPVEALDRLDLTIDGADQVAPSGWLVKGGGGAHTREKILATAAERFIVIVSADKLVDELVAPIPLELLAFGVGVTLRALAPSRLRAAPPSPDGGLIADYHGAVGSPARLAARFSSTPGVIEHGLFPPELVSEILAASRDGSVTRLSIPAADEGARLQDCDRPPGEPE
jgi:ribose 5-phosphate isomerase A